MDPRLSRLALRPASADDIEAIATVWHRGWLDGHLGIDYAAEIPGGTIPVRCRRYEKRVKDRALGVEDP